MLRGYNIFSKCIITFIFFRISFMCGIIFKNKQVICISLTFNSIMVVNKLICPTPIGEPLTSYWHLISVFSIFFITFGIRGQDRKSTRLNSSHVSISYFYSLSLHDALPISFIFFRISFMCGIIFKNKQVICISLTFNSIMVVNKLICPTPIGEPLTSYWHLISVFSIFFITFGIRG